MRRYRVPESLQAPWFGELDPRLRRELRLWMTLGVIFSIVVLLTPSRRLVFTPHRIVPRERKARVLAPPKPVPPRRIEAPVPEAAKKPPPPPRATPRAERKAPPPERPRPPRRQRVRKAPRDPNVGRKGREAGEAVARKLEKTQAGIDNLLSSLGGTVPAVPGTSGRPGRGGKKVAVRGSRDAGTLVGVDDALAASGAGSGTRSRGVQRQAIEIADRGVEATGEFADVDGRDSRSLMAVVQRYKAGIKFCYDNELKKQPGLTGKITLQLDIAASGRVQGIRVVSDSMRNRALQKCIQMQVRNWKFPRIDGGTVRFTLPLVFTPPEN